MKVVRAVLLLFSLCVFAELQADDDHFGVWSGTLTEMVVAGQQYSHYEVTLTVSPNGYRVDYDSLGCGGTLQLLLHKGRFYRFRDVMNYGRENCSSGGRTEIHFINEELATFQWFDQQGELKVEGRLRRSRQVMT